MSAERPYATGPRALVWYAAYGSNMHLDRFTYYLRGGRPPHAARTYPGCRDRTLPTRSKPVRLPGELYFALESPTWTGGMGFYDPGARGSMPARAYLLTVGQFADIAAQEMRRAPGTDIDVSEAVTEGRATLGPGRYETLVCPARLDGHPVLTFTAPWRRHEAALNAPAPAYLRHLASGLREAHGWSRHRIAAYLAERPGAFPRWTREDVAYLCGNGDAGPQ